jgi:flavodoxin
MRIAIVHVSVHHHNTAKVATAMADAVGAELLTVSEATERPSDRWDLVGLGSGIFFGSHHKSLLRLADRWEGLPENCFLFSTAGLPSLQWFWHRSLQRILHRRLKVILGDACFPGWDTVGPLRWIGGIQRGRPNAQDLAHAAAFAKRMRDIAQESSHPATELAAP